MPYGLCNPLISSAISSLFWRLTRMLLKAITKLQRATADMQTIKAPYHSSLLSDWLKCFTQGSYSSSLQNFLHFAFIHWPNLFILHTFSLSSLLALLFCFKLLLQYKVLSLTCQVTVYFAFGFDYHLPILKWEDREYGDQQKSIYLTFVR